MPKTREGGVNFMVCLPPEMKQWLEAEARTNWTSQNAEIIRAVRARMNVSRSEKVAG